MLWQPSLPERYTKAKPEDLARDIAARRKELGKSLVILGHHYQVDEIIQHADFIGDSLKLSQTAAKIAAEQPVKWVVFCGVHFMAETADMLTPEQVEVILPDLSAGCSMADMAAYEDTVEAWDRIRASLAKSGWKGRVIPITYVNSTAAIKAFVGAHGGACCTSSNAKRVFEWAMSGGDLGGTTLRGVRSSVPEAPTGLQPVPDFFDRNVHPLRPTGFVGKDPYPPGHPSPASLVKSRRSLPHLEIAGATYFITWRLSDDRDRDLSPEEMNVVLDAMTHFDDQKCRVYAANVMTTHAHWIVRPFEGQSMQELTASVKRFSSTQVNKLRGDKGHLWLPESFDHIVRDVDSFDWFVRYAVNNPVEARVVSKPSMYKWTRVHSDAGWEQALARVRGGDQSAHASESRATKEHDDIKIIFLPDQHLGRNTAAAYGVDVATQTGVYDPKKTAKGEALGGMTPEQLAGAKVILWAGHCSVHKLFRPEHCDAVRTMSRDIKILVHPECCKEVVDKADLNGSTEFIIKTLRAAEKGSRWAVGTEVHLVKRLARECAARGVEVQILSDCQCLCTTMFRIDQPHLLWVLDNLAGALSKDGKPKVVNAIRVHPEVRKDAVLALERMLGLSGVASLAQAD